MKDRYINPFTDFGFKRLFEAAEIARFDAAEREAYEESIKVYRDLKNVIDTGRAEGLEEGLAKGRLEGAIQIARQMKAAGEPVKKIIAYTGSTAEQIKTL